MKTTVPDPAGQVTTIERDAAGNATAVVAPGGQRTTLTIEANGYLASITNPNNETVELTYTAEGLLTSLKDARGALHPHTYDAQGRLIKDEDPAGGFKALARTDLPTGWSVALSTALNRTTTYTVEDLPVGDRKRTVTDPSGLMTTSVIGANGTTTLTAPDGTITTPVEGPDPRFGMQAPLLKSLSVKLPSGLTSTLSTTRAVSLSNPNDPLSLATQTDTLVINSRTYTSVFNQANKTLTTTTPAGRTSQVTLDTKGRVSQEQVTGLEAVSYSYDAVGRLSTITQGTGPNARSSLLFYNSQNELTNISDPEGRTVSFEYDLAGRITKQILPDLRELLYSYDANGNVTSVTPPGKPAHGFVYTPVDLEQDYQPPDAGFTPKNTTYSYNLDRQLDLVTRPDGQTLDLNYDTGGRLSTLVIPGETIQYAYSSTTGNLASITAPGRTLAYSYDGSLLKQTTWSGTVAGSVSRNYDNNFRITSQSINGANTITFGYDNDSLLTSAGALTITRSAQHGLITGTTVGTVTDSRSYSSFGELSGHTANVSGSPLLSATYTGRKGERVRSCNHTLAMVVLPPMARPLRLAFPHAVYHITGRGNARQDIVADDDDRRRFLACLAHVVERYGWLCHAYCLMANHYHLLMETPQPNLSQGMRQLNGLYTQAYNRRHRRVGHLFQGRFKAVLVEKETHLLELCRYVVLNPVRAKVVPHPRQWAWSSYRATVGEAERPAYLTVDWILGHFGKSVHPAQERYRAFVAEGRGQPRPWDQLTGQIYLGTEDFVARHQPNRVIRDIPRRQTQAQRPSLLVLFQRGRNRDRVIHEAYRRHGYRLAEIATHLGVHYATVSRWLRQAEQRDV